MDWQAAGEAYRNGTWIERRRIELGVVAFIAFLYLMLGIVIVIETVQKLLQRLRS